MGTLVITADQLAAIKADMTRIAASFADPEIAALWARNVSASTEYIQMGATKALMVEAALNDAIGSVDYKAGNTSESLSQYVEQLERLFKRYSSFLDMIAGRRQIAIGAVRDARPQPAEPEDNSTNDGVIRL